MSRQPDSPSVTVTGIQSRPALTVAQRFAQGLALHQQGRLEEASRIYTQVLAAQPDHFDARQLLGAIALTQGQHQRAVDLISAALQINNQHAAAHTNLGAALKELGRADEALASHDMSLVINPQSAQAHFNRAMTLLTLQRPAEAVQALEKTLELQPNFPAAQSQWGVVLMEVVSRDPSMPLTPSQVDAICSRAHALLLAGDYAQGWRWYEWRWKQPVTAQDLPQLSCPLWLGEESLEGKTIIVHGEQGLGDMIQFARYVPMVAALGARVVLAVNKALTPMLARLPGVAQTLIKGDTIPPHDYRCPLMSLPLAFKTTLDNMPPASAYLSATAAKREQWGRWLGHKTKPRVGLVWSGNPRHQHDQRRSMKLAQLLRQLPAGCEYVSLQNEVRPEDVAALHQSAVRHAGDLLQDFDDTAALCEAMDVIVSVDTSVAHLAGALGKPVWLLLPHVPDWRWLLVREDSPWYPSMKLYRQAEAGDWDDPLQRVRTELLTLRERFETQRKRDTAAALNRLVEEGMALHKRGDLAGAAQAYEKVLVSQPGHFDAQHLLGVVALQGGQHERAVSLIGRALKIKPGSATALTNLGVALKDLNRHDEALASLDKALALRPNHADALVNRGVVLKELGRTIEAIEAYQRAIGESPAHEGAHYNLGNALLAAKRHDEALTCYDKVIALNPANALAHYNRGMALKALKQFAEAGASADAALAINPQLALAHNLRGMALDGLNRLQESVASYELALQHDPRNANAHYNLGIVWAKLKDHHKALVCYDRALALDPAFADAHVNRGIVLSELLRFDEAVASYRQAIALDPAHALAYSNLGNALRETGADETAMLCYDKAIALDPGYAEACWNKSLGLLLRGDLQTGLPLYEWRNDVELYKHKKRHFTQPAWTGEQSLASQTVLLYAEQGFGDTLQFCRYAPLVAARGAKVVLEVQRPLLDLLTGLKGVAQVVAAGDELPAFDMQCSIMSLPFAFGTTLESIPAKRKYLQASAELKKEWTKRLGRSTGRLRVGLAWSGNPQHRNDHNRSLVLRDLLTCLPEGPQYVCVQKELREADKAVLADNPQIGFYGSDLNDFSDTAALCAKLDLIISVDTSVAHLAGALGVPTWLLLPQVPDWRWLLEREDSPWYPSMKLYRQQQRGDWTAVFERVRGDLMGVVNGRG